MNLLNKTISSTAKHLINATGNILTDGSGMAIPESSFDACGFMTKDTNQSISGVLDIWGNVKIGGNYVMPSGTIQDTVVTRYVLDPNNQSSAIGDYAKKYYLTGYEFTSKILNSIAPPNDSLKYGLKVGYGFKSVGDDAFRAANINYVELPDSVEYIGKYAFEQSNIFGLPMNNNLKVIDEYAFSLLWNYGSSAELGFPSSLEYIGERAFEGIPSYGSVFFGATANDANLKYVGKEAFYYSAMSSLFLPKTLETVESGAFAEMQNLNNLYLDCDWEVLVNSSSIFSGSIASLTGVFVSPTAQGYGSIFLGKTVRPWTTYPYYL